jgi:hypothetical protein
MVVALEKAGLICPQAGVQRSIQLQEVAPARPSSPVRVARVAENCTIARTWPGGNQRIRRANKAAIESRISLGAARPLCVLSCSLIGTERVRGDRGEASAAQLW